MVSDEPRYAELHAHSAFTFLEGTDEPADMVAQASRLGLDALAILDVDGMYSTVQTTMAARDCGLPVVWTPTRWVRLFRVPMRGAGGWLPGPRSRGSVCRCWPGGPTGTKTSWA